MGPNVAPPLLVQVAWPGEGCDPEYCVNLATYWSDVSVAVRGGGGKSVQSFVACTVAPDAIAPVVSVGCDPSCVFTTTVAELASAPPLFVSHARSMFTGVPATTVTPGAVAERIGSFTGAVISVEVGP